MLLKNLSDIRNKNFDEKIIKDETILEVPTI